MKFRATGLFVKDMAVMVAFYRDVLGLPIEWDGKDAIAIAQENGHRLYFYGRSDFEKMAGQSLTCPSGVNGSFQLALDVDSEEEVDIQFDRAVKKGAAPVIAPKTYPWGLRSCFIADPEGNLVEIATWDDNWRDK